MIDCCIEPFVTRPHSVAAAATPVETGRALPAAAHVDPLLPPPLLPRAPVDPRGHRHSSAPFRLHEHSLVPSPSTPLLRKAPPRPPARAPSIARVPLPAPRARPPQPGQEGLAARVRESCRQAVERLGVQAGAQARDDGTRSSLPPPSTAFASSSRSFARRRARGGRSRRRWERRRRARRRRSRHISPRSRPHTIRNSAIALYAQCLNSNPSPRLSRNKERGRSRVGEKKSEANLHGGAARPPARPVGAGGWIFAQDCADGGALTPAGCGAPRRPQASHFPPPRSSLCPPAGRPRPRGRPAVLDARARRHARLRARRGPVLAHELRRRRAPQVRESPVVVVARVCA